MSKSRAYYVKHAKITYLKRQESKEYSDGDEVEDHLLKLFKNGLSDEDRRKILNEDPPWAIKYHLAYERNNLLGWYPFEPNSRILEIGAGCGSITESLVANKDISVVSNDLSERRCMINAYRNRATDNLEIIIGNLYDYQPEQLFDYVVCVGVYEYAGTFIDTKKPYYDFLNKLVGFLKPNGTLLLAVENQLGIKYLAGAREDHTGHYFDGINDYPDKKAVRTFGRKELTKNFNDAGFKEVNYYYPFPDYKMPTIIYSDNYFPGKNSVHFPKGLLPTPNPDQSREYIFSEAAFMSILERNGMFRDHSNSFLLEAKKP